MKKHELIRRVWERVTMPTWSTYGLARRLARGKRVLDVGGSMICPSEAQRAQYAAIRDGAATYANLDIQPGADYVADLNTWQGHRRLWAAIDRERPDVILCLETIEHLTNPGAVLALFADAKCAVLLSVPSIGQTLLDLISWNDHHVATYTLRCVQNLVGASQLKNQPLRWFRQAYEPWQGPCTRIGLHSRLAGRLLGTGWGCVVEREGM